MFPLDYMHLVCLGVVRKMLNWFKSGSFKVRMKSAEINRISEHLLFISNLIPFEINRKPRSLLELANWKATEFRTFLLYTGPVVLKKILTKELYTHFLKLHVAMRILLNPFLCIDQNQLASDLLREYVTQAPVLYGEEFMSYNVHSLIHLSSDALRYGHLDRISAFPFENLLGNLKRKIRKHDKELPQIVRRCVEYEIHRKLKSNNGNQLNFYGDHYDGPISVNFKGYQYKKVSIQKLRLSTLNPDSCVILKNGEILRIRNILRNDDGAITFAGNFFKTKKNLYHFNSFSNGVSSLFLSSSLDVFKVSDLDNVMSFVSIKYLKCKAVCLSIMPTQENDCFAVFPLLMEPNE